MLRATNWMNNPNTSTFDRNPISFGMDPFSEFKLNLKFVKFVKDPIGVGRIPVKAACKQFTLKQFSESDPILEGIGPAVKEVEDRPKDVNPPQKNETQLPWERILSNGFGDRLKNVK